jgi:hypothetical protein
MKGPVIAISLPYLSTVGHSYLHGAEFKLFLAEDGEARAVSAYHGKGRNR